MVAIVTRAGKGSPLTNAEVDSNFTNLNNGKLETSNNLSDLASAATARTNLGLGSLSTLNSISLSGDATGTSNGTGSLALTLANSGVTAGTYGNATNIPQFAVDAKGRITSVSNVAVSIPSGSLNFTGDVTGSGSTGSSTALTLANSGVTAGTYTKLTVDAKGRVTGGASLASADLPTYTGSLTSSQVTTALGFTPYNSSNPSGYITSGSAGFESTNTNLGYSSSATNTSAGGQAGPQIRGQGGGGAVMSFHRPSAFAINMGLDSDNVFRIGGWSASSNRLQMDMSGNLTMAGNVTAYSDETLKTDWLDVSVDFVERLATVKHGTYTRIDSGDRQAGASAQAMQSLLPEVVTKGADGILSLAYGNAALVSAIQLAQRVVSLTARLHALEQKMGA